MKAAFVLTILISLSLALKAQDFAIVNDPDGYVNVRKSGKLNSKILWKEKNGHLLVVSDIDKSRVNWSEIYSPSFTTDFTGKTTELRNLNAVNGYVYTNRLTPLKSLKHISPKSRKLSNNTLSLANDSVQLYITTKPFRFKNHRILKDKDGYVKMIDNKQPYGVDGGLPKVEISAVKLILKGQELIIDNDAFDDLFQPSLKNFNIYFDSEGNIYIQSQNSDGAGAYSLVWVVSKGKLVRRYVDNSEA